MFLREGSFRREAYTLTSLIDSADQGRFDRADRCSPSLFAFYAKEGAIEAHTPSCSGRGGAHSQVVQIVDWDRIIGMHSDNQEFVALFTDPNRKITWQEAMRFLRDDVSNADVRVYCSCEDFLYSGAAYFTTTMSSTYPGFEEGRVPTRTWKLALRNMVCKHLVAVYYRFFEFI